MLSTVFQGPDGDALLKRSTVLVYLATNSVPGTFADTPWQELSANVEHAFQVFWRATSLNPTIRIVLISSGGTVYGDQPGHATPETTKLAPVSGYGLGKVMIEEALRFVHRRTDAPIAILRVSNPVGLHQVSNRQGIVPMAIRAVHEKRPVVLFGGGHQVRDYVDADDVADAIITASRPSVGPAGIWNVGSGTGHSVRDILTMVETVTGRTIAFEHRPGRSVDIGHIVLDVNLAWRQLGWKPGRPILDSIRSIKDFYEKTDKNK